MVDRAEIPEHRELTDEERCDWLQLCRARGVGPITFFRLLSRFGSAADALDALPQLSQGRSIEIGPREAALGELECARRLGARMLVPGEAAYPARLAAISDPPPAIFVRGNADLNAQTIAIVGARNASSAGRRMASDLARDLGEAGYTIASGLARGIDGAAHLAAMPTGTVAVIAGGIDQVYPPEHAGLYQAIADNGAVVSEVPYGHVARAQDFPKRNRIVSGLALGVIVVEAAEQSGTLITARLANEQGRDVFAVPGSPLDPRSSGTNRLIRQGAALVRHADDVLEELAGPSRLFEASDPYHSEPALSAPPETSLKLRVLTALGTMPIHRDEIVRDTGATAAQIADALLDLVLEGAVEESTGGMFSRTAANLSSM